MSTLFQQEISAHVRIPDRTLFPTLVIPVEQVKPPAKVMVLTGASDSYLSKIADVCISTISEEVGDRTDALLSRSVQFVVVDTLYTAGDLRSGQQAWEQLGKTKYMLSYLKY